MSDNQNSTNSLAHDIFDAVVGVYSGFLDAVGNATHNGDMKAAGKAAGILGVIFGTVIRV